MTKQNYKPIYAKNNSDWRIRYASNGKWELQEFSQLPDGTDRRRNQPWRTHNTSMSYDDAIMRLGAYDLRVRA